MATHHALARSAAALAVALLLLASGPAAAHGQARATDADPRADSLVAGWIEAVGGMETYHDFRRARYTYATELHDPETGRLRRVRPRYVALAKLDGHEMARIERWTWDGASFVVQGFDGDTTWAHVNGEPAPSDHREREEAVYVTADVFYWFSLPYKLRDPGVNLHFEGTDSEGRNVVRVTFGEGVGDHQDTWWYRFEDGRSWPVEGAYREEGSANVNRFRWVDLRSVDGYTYPAQRVHVNGDGRVWKILRFSDVELNPELERATFSDPEVSPWEGR